MERKRDFRGRFRLGAEMETSSEGSGSGLEIEDCQSERLHQTFIVPAIGELLVKYKRPKYDFEKWDWMLFQWPHDRADANFEMGISELDAMFESDKKRYDEFIERKAESRIEKQETTQSRKYISSSKENQETDEDFCTNNPEITKNCTLGWIDESQYLSPDTSL